jgi:2-C-methyl-D-erythritol 4-phosphate cytidylyltransferase / 2-C-methyl-D-erythritol 2,4-cyclodiphosphate synthase
MSHQPEDSADAIIVAAGTSSRMGGIDKLLVDIDGRPLLAHTLAAIAAAEEVASIVVVTTDARRRALAAGGWVDGERVTFVEGGERRQDSVAAGFEALERIAPDESGDRVVLVHDGARPVVSATLVADVIAATERAGAAVPVVPVTETVKRVVDGRIAATIDREDLVSTQTPQGIRRSLLRQALADPKAARGTWTDEAALLEACTIPVDVVPGDPSNVKVTVPDDLRRAALTLSDASRSRRTGIGQDSHPFGPGGPLHLGGIEIPGAPALYGHSDGDVALHALADALLGASGMGDLGRLFPAGPSTPRGADSRELLAAVVARLAGEGWRPVGVDLTIIAARPRLGAFLESMRDAIADSLGLESGAVNVKASTGNLDGPEGAGRSISALAIATIEAAR